MDKDSLIYITGGAGFIGSNLVRHLNGAGYENIVVIDDLTDVRKFKNLRGLKFAYLDKDEFRADMADILEFDGVAMVFHLGAISSTIHKNGKELMDQNYRFSIDLIGLCAQLEIPIHYASSASVYGNEKGGAENPLNGYAFSKWMVDQFVRDVLLNGTVGSQILGFRYFNVYGPNEEHKDGQASVIYNWRKQLMETGSLKLFKEEAGRVFVSVDDVCRIHLWAMDHPASGIIDVGTGKATSFAKIAKIVVKWYDEKFIIPSEPTEWGLKSNSWAEEHTNNVRKKLTHLIDMPEELKGQYQFFTQAGSSLADLGYTEKLLCPEEGVLLYLEELDRRRVAEKGK